jgi:hypothetical protein
MKASGPSALFREDRIMSIDLSGGLYGVIFHGDGASAVSELAPVIKLHVVEEC